MAIILLVDCWLFVFTIMRTQNDKIDLTKTFCPVIHQEEQIVFNFLLCLQVVTPVFASLLDVAFTDAC